MTLRQICTGRFVVIALSLINALVVFVYILPFFREQGITRRIKKIDGRVYSEPVLPVKLPKSLSDFFSHAYAVNLQGRTVTDAILRDVVSFRDLRELYVGNTQIDDAKVGIIKAALHLQHLELSDTKVTLAGLKELRSLSNLRSLDVRNIDIDDSAIEGLQILTQLTQISIDNKRISKEGRRRIQMALPRCHIIQ